METIGSLQLWSLLENSEKAETSSNTRVRAGNGHLVASFLELAQKVAELQFRNRDYVFLFRGQRHDYRNRQGNTSLRPSLLRERSSNESFERLRAAEDLLVREYKLTGRDRLARHQALRWSILQHYKVCDTPLLDVTQSLRIAASFASENATAEAYVYALGVPNISGAITASAEAGIEVIRLSSVCPPEAVRPHIQEGYLLSEYPELSDSSQKKHYDNSELDFALRLVAKFRFLPGPFWEANSAFPIVPRSALYPAGRHDPLLEICERIKQQLS
jgi:hypothetical protein